MDILEVLKIEGWHLSNDAIQQLSNGDKIDDVRVLHNKALDMDLREIAVPYFPDDIVKGKIDSIPGNVIVQIQKVRNISAPKANEESQVAPRMLKVVLTDGHTICHAIEVDSIKSISLNTAPGTKVLLKGETLALSCGLLLLRPNCISVLGGKVSALVDKWELNRSLAKHIRGRIGEEGGPPPWIPFGQKIQCTTLQEKNFKSLVEMAARENAEFEAQRQGAIAEAARGGARKVFGGGSKPIVDRNVQTIIDLGYSQVQAEQALKQARNNVDRALQHLQRQGGGVGMKGGGREERGWRRRVDRDEEVLPSSGPKPSGQVSLFAFLEDKLPTQTEKEENENENKGSVDRLNQHSGYHKSHTSSNRGRVSTNTGHSSYNGVSDPRSREDHIRPNNNVNKNQKPPRFQNQHHQRFNDAYQNWSFSGNYDHACNDNIPNNSRLNSRHFEELNNENYSKRMQVQPSSVINNSERELGRSNRQYELLATKGLDVGGASRGAARFSYNRQLLEAGMPEIPDFPFKDVTTLSPYKNTVHTDIHNSGAQSQSLATPTSTNSATEPVAWQWRIGDKCMAKYWEDNMYYNAEVTGLSKKTCVVRFLEYGNFEEVLQDDCIPLTEEQNNENKSGHTTNNNFSGILEFRRGGTRPYVKSADSSHRKARHSQPMYTPPAYRRD